MSVPFGGLTLGEPVTATLTAPGGSERGTTYGDAGVPIILRRFMGVLMQPTGGDLQISEMGIDLSQRRFILVDAMSVQRVWPILAGDHIVIPDGLPESGDYRIARVSPWSPWHIEVEVEVQP